jgi:hypothetical protein
LTRREKILLLAWSSLDLLKMPTGMNLRGSKGKAGASKYEPCLACGGSWRVGAKTGERHGYRSGQGWKLDPFKRKIPCEACGGHMADGQLVAGTGRIGVDEMLHGKHRTVGTTENTLAARRVQRWVCNFCHGNGVSGGRHEGPACKPCEGTGAREHSSFVLLGVREDGRLVDPADPATALEEAIERRDRAGSYHEFDVCIGELWRRSPHQARVFHQVHVVGTVQPETLGVLRSGWLEEALTFLDRHMPAEIVVPAEIVEASKRDPKRNQLRARGRHAPPEMLDMRDRLIRERFAAGHGESARELAREFGLSVQRVNEIVYNDREAVA